MIQFSDLCEGEKTEDRKESIPRGTSTSTSDERSIKKNLTQKTAELGCGATNNILSSLAIPRAYSNSICRST